MRRRTQLIFGVTRTRRTSPFGIRFCSVFRAPLLSVFVLAAVCGLATAPTPVATPFEMLSLNKSTMEVLMVQHRLRELNYFSYKCTGSYGAMTQDAVIRFQQGNSIGADGVVGEETFYALFRNTAIRAPIASNVKIPIGPTTNKMPAVVGVDAPWSEVDPLFQTGQSYNVYDLNTNRTFDIQRVGGVNHARVETASNSDTDVFLEVFGGEINWSKRPVMIAIAGRQFAASLQGMPQGQDSIAGNGMDGSCALYFSGSTSDIANLPDTEHRTAVNRAAGIGW